MGGYLDVDGMNLLSVLYFDQASCRFVSDYGLHKIRFWSLEGRRRAIVIVSLREVVSYKLLCKCELESYIGEEIEGLTAKFSEMLTLFGRTRS